MSGFGGTQKVITALGVSRIHFGMRKTSRDEEEKVVLRAK
jgi:hypothetical protein